MRSQRYRWSDAQQERSTAKACPEAALLVTPEEEIGVSGPRFSSSLPGPVTSQLHRRMAEPRLGEAVIELGYAPQHSGLAPTGDGAGDPSTSGQQVSPSVQPARGTLRAARCAAPVGGGHRGRYAGAAPGPHGSGTTSRRRWPPPRRNAAPETARARARLALVARGSGNAETARATCLALPHHSAE